MQPKAVISMDENFMNQGCAVVIRIKDGVGKAFFIKDDKVSVDYHFYLAELAEQGYCFEFK